MKFASIEPCTYGAARILGGEAVPERIACPECGREVNVYTRQTGVGTAYYLAEHHKVTKQPS